MIRTYFLKKTPLRPTEAVKMEDYDIEDKSEQEILLSFTANKVHRTEQFKKITNLLALQEQKYSKSTEKTLLKAVSDIERYLDRLTLLAEYPRISRGSRYRG